jgi:hypothetical protein
MSIEAVLAAQIGGDVRLGRLSMANTLSDAVLSCHN